MTDQIVKTFAKQLSKNIDEHVYGDYLEKLFYSGVELGVFLTEATIDDWGLVNNYLKLNLNNCKGFVSHVNGNIEMDISIHGNGGWYSLSKDEYVCMVVLESNMTVRAHFLTAVLEEMSLVEPSVESEPSTVLDDSNVVKVDFGRK